MQATTHQKNNRRACLRQWPIWLLGHHQCNRPRVYEQTSLIISPVIATPEPPPSSSSRTRTCNLHHAAGRIGVAGICRSPQKNSYKAQSHHLMFTPLFTLSYTTRAGYPSRAIGIGWNESAPVPLPRYAACGLITGLIVSFSRKLWLSLPEKLTLNIIVTVLRQHLVRTRLLARPASSAHPVTSAKLSTITIWGFWRS